MKERFSIFIIIFFLFVMTNFISGCVQDTGKAPAVAVPSRESRIPSDAIKVSPVDDSSPPVLYSNEYEVPVPLSGMINTAGAEVSPFIAADRNELYFFFTPDVRVPTERGTMTSGSQRK
jgi:hypothetical protein